MTVSLGLESAAWSETASTANAPMSVIFIIGSLIGFDLDKFQCA
jgi:hypothetical protein